MTYLTKELDSYYGFADWMTKEEIRKRERQINYRQSLLGATDEDTPDSEAMADRYNNERE